MTSPCHASDHGDAVERQQHLTLTDFTISSDYDATSGDWQNRTLEASTMTTGGYNGFGIGAKLNVGGDQPSWVRTRALTP